MEFIMRKIIISTSLLVSLAAQAAGQNTTGYDPANWGISFGSPGLVNLDASFVLESTTLKASVGYGFLAIYDGFELGATLTRWPSSDSLRSVQIIAGENKIKDMDLFSSSASGTKEWRYIGMSATWRSGSLFFEPAFTVGEGDYDSPRILLKAGWLWNL